MRNEHYKSDIRVELTLRVCGAEVPYSGNDFKAVFYTRGSAEYVCWRAGDEWHGCERGVNGRIMFLLDNHGLPPGELKVRYEELLPDVSFASGFQRRVTVSSLGVVLTTTGERSVRCVETSLPVDLESLLSKVEEVLSLASAGYVTHEDLESALSKAGGLVMIEALGEPPADVGAAGTVCRVAMQGWTQLEDGDTVTFPLMVTQWEPGMFCNSLFFNRYGMDNYGLCWDDHGQPMYLDERVGEGGAKLYNDDWEIDEYYAAGYTDAGFENFNPNGLIFEAYVWGTVGYKLYMSDGTRWMELGENGGSGGTPNIYVEMREDIQDGNGDLMKMLVVRGAEPFLNDDFVPVLLRHSRKKNGWGWHHYNPAQYKAGGQDKSPDDVVVDDFGGYKVVYVLGAELNHELVNMPRPHYNDGGIIDCSDGDVLDDILAATVVLHVSHGKRKFAVLELDGDIGEPVTRTIRTKWGLAFIRRSDYPALNERLDVSKLASNIAPFTIYYGWRKDYELNDKVLCTRVLT